MTRTTKPAHRGTKHRPQTWTCPACGGRFKWGSPTLQIIQRIGHLATNCIGTRR